MHQTHAKCVRDAIAYVAEEKEASKRECLPTAFQLTLRTIGLRHVHFALVSTRIAS